MANVSLLTASFEGKLEKTVSVQLVLCGNGFCLSDVELLLITDDLAVIFAERFLSIILMTWNKIEIISKDVSSSFTLILKFRILVLKLKNAESVFNARPISPECKLMTN